MPTHFRILKKSMFIGKAIVLFSFMALASIAHCQQPTLQDPFLDHMAGRWVLTGQVMGKSTTHDVQAKWVLNHQFIRIHEKSREKNAQGWPQYQADVYIGWDANAKQYVIHWIDVYGGGFSLRGSGTKTGSSIPFVFKSPQGDFHTDFIFDVHFNSWQWNMDTEQNGSLKPFARLTLAKSKIVQGTHRRGK